MAEAVICGRCLGSVVRNSAARCVAFCRKRTPSVAASVGVAVVVADVAEGAALVRPTSLRPTSLRPASAGDALPVRRALMIGGCTRTRTLLSMSISLTPHCLAPAQRAVRRAPGSELQAADRRFDERASSWFPYSLQALDDDLRSIAQCAFGSLVRDLRQSAPRGTPPKIRGGRTQHVSGRWRREISRR